MDYKRKLLIKYSLEFVVIVVGISVTFWIDEWNRNRIEQIQHVKDIESIIDDLDNDSLIINRVNQSLDTGRLRTDRLINLIELKLDNKIGYNSYYKKIINIGYLWSYQTFFMTDATYKSLISNGRINLYPQNIHSMMNKYYEATAKRINDHNKIVDDIAIKYYTYYHPFSMLFTNENFRNNLRGEITLVLSEKKGQKNNNKLSEFDKKKIKKLIKKFSIKDIVQVINENNNISKKEIYDFCLTLKNEK